MKFAVAKEHRDYFARHHYITFEEVLTFEESSLLGILVKTLLLKRLKKPLLEDVMLSEQFLGGRDLWREDLALQKILFSRRLAEIAASLFKQPLLRIALDQYFVQPSLLSLQQMSCIDPLVGAVALPINNMKGTVIYFSPTKPLTLPFLDEPVLILAYAGERAQYCLKKEDPNTHFLKKYGCAFGDILKNDTHPILFR